MIVAGCDVGSLSAKAVVIRNNSIMGSEIIPVRPEAVLSATDVMNRLISKLGITYGDIDRCASTGYGRGMVPFAQADVNEVSCHGRGAHWLMPGVRTIIDGGGQDFKVLCVDSKGHLKSFRMSGKCAAGAGRSMEIMAESLGIDVSEIGPLSLCATSPVILEKNCSVMNEIEVKRLVVEGVDNADIAAGITRSIARQLKLMLDCLDYEEKIAVSGGVAKNIGVVKQLEEMLGTECVQLPADPQLIGAIGAAVFAADQLKRFGSRCWRSRTDSNLRTTL